jgi:hypothetical protein
MTLNLIECLKIPMLFFNISKLQALFCERQKTLIERPAGRGKYSWKTLKNQGNTSFIMVQGTGHEGTTVKSGFFLPVYAV